MNARRWIRLGCLCAVVLSGTVLAQTEYVGLPEEGAPKAEAGPYEVAVGAAFGAPRLKTFRPESLDPFPRRDGLPVVVWGSGGCFADSSGYTGFLSTIASHGFLVITTALTSQDDGRRVASADDLEAAIDWADAENGREGSPLKGKIETKRVAVMGTSCGGALAITVGADPRVRTIGVFNFGVVRTADAPPPPPFFPSVDALKKLHGPVLLINGHERDFMMAPSKGTYDAVENVPVFYGARHGAGHLGTFSHAGGGEFANVATQWALWQLKGDRKASAMFVGTRCTLCTDTRWSVESKRLAR